MIYIILGFLMLRAMTKYDIKCNLEKEVSPFYSPSYGSINHSVTKLLKDDWITFVVVVEKGRQKKIYSLTDAGRKAFYEWLKEPVLKVTDGKLLISKMYFFGFLEKDEQVKSLKAYHTAVSETVENYYAFQDGFNSEEVSDDYQSILEWQMHTLRYGIMEYETEKRFVEEMLAKYE